MAKLATSVKYPEIVYFKGAFKGKVYVLTNNRTGSTCEPFVYGLKNND